MQLFPRVHFNAFMFDLLILNENEFLLVATQDNSDDSDDDALNAPTKQHDREGSVTHLILN